MFVVQLDAIDEMRENQGNFILRPRPSTQTGKSVTKFGSSSHKSTFFTGLSQISSHILSRNAFQADVTYCIRDPLVAIIGVGDYENDVMPPLVGVNMDYLNSIYTFHYKLGYSVLFQNKLANSVEYITKNGNAEIDFNKCKEQVKTYWLDDEIEQFFDNVKLYTLTHHHDAVIFLISAHGDSEGVILDCQGEEVSLGVLFSSFQGQECTYLIDKPKIAFVDACRGSMRSKPYYVPQKQEKQEKETNGNPAKSKMISQADKWTSDMSSSGFSNDAPSIIIEPNQTTSGGSGGGLGGGGVIAADAYASGPGGLGSPGSPGSPGSDSDSINKSSIEPEDAHYHTNANFRYVYGNPEGYAVADGGSKGGYLIRSIKRVFSNVDVLTNSQTLDTIVHQIRKQTKKLVGKGSVQCVEDVNTMTYEVVFEEKGSKPKHYPPKLDYKSKLIANKNKKVNWNNNNDDTNDDDDDGLYMMKGINLDESRFENWTQKEVVWWMKQKLAEKGIDAKKIKSFMTEFRTKLITGSVLKELQNQDDYFNQLKNEFSIENQAFGMWMIIKTSVNSLGQ